MNIFHALGVDNLQIIPVPVEKPKRGVYLYGEFMHGDADANDTKELYILTEEEFLGLRKYLKYLDELDGKYGNGRIKDGNLENENEESFRKVSGITDDYYFESLLSEWWGRDITNDSSYCSLQKWYFRYFDGDRWWDIVERK